MSRRRWLAIGAACVVLAFALGGVSLAKTSAAKGEKTERAKYAALYRERLAKRLGVGAAALDSARKQALEDVIAQALKDGTITPTQAGQLRARLAEGLDEGFPGGWFFGHKDKMHFAKGPAFNAALAAVLAKLGMDRGELKSSLRSGKTLEQIAKEHGTTLAALGSIAANAAKPVLDAMVKDGRLTQARANEILAALKSGKLSMFGRHHGGFEKAA